MSIKKLLLSALLLTTTGFAYAEDTTGNYIKINNEEVNLVAGVDDEDEGIIYIDLVNVDEHPWVAMQFDMCLPEGVDIAQEEEYGEIFYSVECTDRMKYRGTPFSVAINKLKIKINDVDRDVYRFVIYDGTGNKPIKDKSANNNNPAILEVRLIATDQASTGEYDAYILNAILADSPSDGSGVTGAQANNGNPTEPSKFTIKINAPIGAGGYGSFSWPRDVVFGDDVEVFTASDYTGNGSLHLNPIAEGKVPAGTGVIIKGDASTIVNPETTKETVEAVTGNSLGETSSAPYEAGSDVFALTTRGGKAGFYPVSAGVVIPQYKAYLTYVAPATGESTAKFISFGDTATSIDALDMAEEEGDIYTLGGQKVQKTTMKGVYIKNGKKVVVK